MLSNEVFEDSPSRKSQTQDDSAGQIVGQTFDPSTHNVSSASFCVTLDWCPGSSVLTTVMVQLGDETNTDSLEQNKW